MEKQVLFGIILGACLIWQVQAQSSVNCTAAGRFADPDDTTCQNYTLCVYNTTSSTYISYDYVCPTTSVFNSNSAQCTASTNYVCNVTNSTTSTNTSICTADGYIADPNSTNCTTYIQCVETNGTFTETTFTCPNGTYYNPNTTLCESTYNCTSTFSCTSAGRFADTTDTTCQTYYLCVLSSDETTYLEYTYTCPTTSVFNPNTSVCTANYTCTN